MSNIEKDLERFSSKIQEIAQKANKTPDEVKKHVIEVTEELEGLISVEGALSVIEKDWGVQGAASPQVEVQPTSTDTPLPINKLPADGIIPFMVVRVLGTIPPRTFTKKDGTEGRFAKLVLQDSTGKVTTTLWNGQIETVTKKIQAGDIISLKNIGARYNSRYNNHEIAIIKNTDMRKVESDQYAAHIGEVQYMQLASIKGDEKDINVKGYIREIKGQREITTKSGVKTLYEVVIADNTSEGMILGAWENAGKVLEPLAEKDVIHCHGLRANTYKGQVSLQLSWNGTVSKKARVK